MRGHQGLETGSNGSAASADTVPADESGRVLPEPPVVPEADLEKFMQTPAGEEYYQRWLKGTVTCRMVRERSGCGLLAKFFGRKIEEDEEQKMLTQAMQVEERMKQQEGHGSAQGDREGDHPDNVGGSSDGSAVKGDNVEDSTEGCDAGPSGVVPIRHSAGVPGQAMTAPTIWPSYDLKAQPTDAIALESHESTVDEGTRSRAIADIPAEEFTMDEAENHAELMFAIAAGNVTANVEAAMTDTDEGVAGDMDEVATAGDEDAVEQMDVSGVETAEDVTGGGNGGSGDGLDASHAADEREYGTNTANGTTGSEDHTTSASEGLVQTNLRSWLA